MLSKRATYVAITVLAALSVEIGCGDGSHKVAQRKSLTPSTTKMVQKTDESGKPMFDAKGKPIMEAVKVTPGQNGTGTAAKPQVGPDGKTVLPNLNVPKADPQLKTISDNEDSQLQGSLTTREQLVAGNYTLDSIVTSVHVSTTNVGEDARAFQTSSYDINAKRLTVTSSANGGMITNFTDNPRRVVIPDSFKIDLSAGAWVPDRTQAANFTFQNKVSLDSNGKLMSQDTPDRDDTTNQAALFNILKNGILQKNGTYLMQIDNVTTILRILKKDANRVTFAMSFEELRNDGKTQNKVTMDRAIIFGYTVTPADNAKTASAADTAAGADTSINVNSTTTGNPLE